ncbi:hypothetical protein COO60DRAFT_1586506 [Scenedesmus sp. NREL 46B-D3]|nr:hypothetical protein COO60DRAFT_1586506 [Scenedesmus sp. NREL 46B-D3]
MQQQQESDMQQVARQTHSNLYVANLPTSIDTEPALRTLFSAYGQIESCRLVRNSRGDGKGSFAFVKFSSINEALAAISALNNAQVGSSVLEVKVADADAGDRNPELLAPPSDNLYAKNLPITLSEDELRALFSPYGFVIECRVLHSGTGRDTAGVGAGALVRMASVEEAAQAITHLHNQRLTGSALPLVVRYADSQEQKQKKAQRQQRQQVERYPAPGSYGHPAMAPAGPYHHHHQQQHQHQHAEHMGYYSPVSPAAYGSGGGGMCSVYIKYLPETTDRLWLYEKFAPFGGVLSVKVLTNEAGLCRGVGFVNYGDQDAAQRAVAAMHGMPMGADKRLHVALQTHRNR